MLVNWKVLAQRRIQTLGRIETTVGSIYCLLIPVRDNSIELTLFYPVLRSTGAANVSFCKNKQIPP